ncbi:zinc-binding protein [Methanolobus chelungpuianus]|uniref:Zinc-binding protein n=2 Tax=Methanolobus chelungpuianus TaxID=502115 RepID=A0AAE3HBJ2_9EURY|nr:zinc-binding protein [Methanolobus chelungpuianus]
MATAAKCACEATVTGLYACAGACNVGQMANKIAVELTKQGKGRMMCTAGIGARIPGIMKSTEGTDEIIAIDGCALTCARKSLELAGFTVNKHVVLTELGMQKNKDLDLQENEVSAVMARVGSALGN